jgi:hypothetical protein
MRFIAPVLPLFLPSKIRGNCIELHHRKLNHQVAFPLRIRDNRIKSAPLASRWSVDAMLAIEESNASPKGVLPTNYAVKLLTKLCWAS